MIFAPPVYGVNVNLRARRSLGLQPSHHGWEPAEFRREQNIACWAGVVTAMSQEWSGIVYSHK